MSPGLVSPPGCSSSRVQSQQSEASCRGLMKFGLTAANRLKFSKGRLHVNTALSSRQMETSGPRLQAASSKPAHSALGLRTEPGTRFRQQLLALGTDGPLYPPLDRAARGITWGSSGRKGDFRRCSFLGPLPAPLNTLSTDGAQEAESLKASPRS